MSLFEGRTSKEKKRIQDLHIHLIDGVGNSTVSQRLKSFLDHNMKGPNAARELLSIMGPVDISVIDDKHHVLKDGKSLFDQVSWAYNNPTKAQKKDILKLHEQALKSLAQEPQERKVRHNGKSELYDLSPDVKEKANKTYEKYKEALKLIDESKPGNTRQIFSLLGLIGSSLLVGGQQVLLNNFGHVNDIKVTSTPYMTVTAVFPTSTDMSIPSETPTSTLTLTKEPIQEKSYSFGELWDMYFMIQSGSDDQKGKVVDFLDYCTQYGGPGGCGFNENDPNFDSQFHGHVNGYRVVYENGKWIYYEKNTPTPTPTISPLKPTK